MNDKSPWALTRYKKTEEIQMKNIISKMEDLTNSMFLTHCLNGAVIGQMNPEDIPRI